VADPISAPYNGAWLTLSPPLGWGVADPISPPLRWGVSDPLSVLRMGRG